MVCHRSALLGTFYLSLVLFGQPTTIGKVITVPVHLFSNTLSFSIYHTNTSRQDDFLLFYNWIFCHWRKIYNLEPTALPCISYYQAILQLLSTVLSLNNLSSSYRKFFYFWAVLQYNFYHVIGIRLNSLNAVCHYFWMFVVATKKLI